ncbi:hypothetical protein ACSBR1_019406 [Camellia fascicularis]
MPRETLASFSSSTSSSGANNPPPEDAWVDAYQRLLLQWQSLSLSLPRSASASVQSIADDEDNVDSGSSDEAAKNALDESIIPISISRVNEVDAQRLDIEMSTMLKEQLVKVFSLVKPGLLFQYEPELDAFLEFLIWRFSIWVDMPIPGYALMNLRYRDERAIEPRGKDFGLKGLRRKQKIEFLRSIRVNFQVDEDYKRMVILTPFLQRPLARRAWTLIQRIEGIYKDASFGNLLIFLYTGRYVF